MNHVKSFDLFGVKTRQLPCIPGAGAPTTVTDGAVGDFYMDTDTGDIYKCTAATDGTYTWVLNGDKPDDIQSQNRHAKYFTITEDGILSLKPEFRGAPADDTYPDAVSDMGVGVAGSKNAELPEHLVIPETVDVGGIIGEVAVDRIADGAFYVNKAIKTITFPKTVKEIPNGCFKNSFVENVYNIEQVTTVGTEAFKRSNLKNVNLPNLESMGEGAFYNCSFMTHVNIGNVSEIPADGFFSCRRLSRIESNNLITSTGHTALHTTPRLANADFVKNLTLIGPGTFIKSGLDYDWSQLENCEFENNATALQINPTDFWSACSVTPCENPMPTVLSQKDPRWIEKPIGNSGKVYSKGCMLFSMMHIYCGIHNLHLSTVEEFENIIEGLKPGHLDTYFNTLEEIPTFVEPLGLTGTLVDVYSEYTLQKLYDALAEGKYAIINTSSGEVDGSMTGHGIAAYGLTPSGKIMWSDSTSNYYNYPKEGGCKYALPYKVTTANLSGKGLPEFCIVSEPIEYIRYATIEDALAETNEVADGVVGAYYDKYGKYHVGLLGDMESETTINIKRNCTFHLNGYTLNFTKPNACLDISKAEEVIIDGTVVRKKERTGNTVTLYRSTIKKDGITNTSAGENLIKTTGTNLTVYGGVYSITNITAPAKKSVKAFTAAATPVAIIKLNYCTIISTANGSAKAYGVQADSVVVNNCDITTESVDIDSIGMSIYKDVVIKNSTFTSTATGEGLARGVSTAPGCTKCDLSNTTIRATGNDYNANNDNSIIGVYVYGLNANITDCDIVVNRVGVDESDYTEEPVTAAINCENGGSVTINGTNNFVPAYQ